MAVVRHDSDEARWVAWPLAGTPAVAMGRVVGKIAQVAG